MSDIDKGTRGENGKSAGIAEVSGVLGAVLDLEAEARNISTQVRQVTKRVIYLGTIELRARASGISDAEGVLGEGVQDSTGIVEKFEGLVTGVEDGRGDHQVLQSVDMGGGSRGPDGQAWSSRDGHRRGDESDERREESRREHSELVGV